MFGRPYSIDSSRRGVRYRHIDLAAVILPEFARHMILFYNEGLFHSFPDFIMQSLLLSKWLPPKCVSVEGKKQYASMLGLHDGKTLVSYVLKVKKKVALVSSLRGDFYATTSSFFPFKNPQEGR
ncbi:hypothetical protein AVEN_93507-1 [Araneus ventricosus]|uniref:Uncharacterized protein n=1 Tax=Araneus ventricosus TaxID=182803 RepID=A0A4Y2ARC5_ARAVE|nr:hypothetical protein AVEN_93507-1 [Araneus ventricosus]